MQFPNNPDQTSATTIKEFSKNQIRPGDKNLENFFKFAHFNQMQQKCLEPVLETTQNILISAPTASGKTVVFELGIIRAMGGPRGTLCDQRLAIYICPNKALSQEKVFQWQQKFGEVWSQLEVVECTSDADFGGDFKIRANPRGLLIGTPEKINQVFVNWKSHRKLVGNLSLLMVDEIHLLSQEGRGVFLESLITRIKSISRMSEFAKRPVADLRLMAVSATLGNLKDVARWLQVGAQGLLVFGKDHRPVKLQKMVLGYNCKTNPFLFDRYLNFKLVDLIDKYSEKKPTLIFVSTQKSAVNTCEKIIELIESGRVYLQNQSHLTKLISSANSVSDTRLKVFLPYGIAFHHSSLSPVDRRLVENQFRDNRLRVLVTTSTLAQGVNLPAYLVIIKGTNGYRGQGKGYSPLSPTEIFQMMGRAGRPQFDTSGRVIVMTERQNLVRMERLINGDFQDVVIQSQFDQELDNNLNSEISSRVIKNYRDALDYFSNSLLHVQLEREASSQQR